MNGNLTLVDLARTGEALFAFGDIAVPPGYVLAWLFDFFRFRQRALLTQLAIAVPLSLGFCPIISYLLGRFAPPLLWVFFGVSTAGFVMLLIRDRHKLISHLQLRRDGIWLALAVGWVVLCALTLVDLQIGRRLYFPTVTYDYSLRSTVTSSITRSGLPAQNPMFFPGRS